MLHRKKLISTAKYIYQALFKEERNSDITVHALGKVWRLHKVYLSQSPYFASMFNGSWREADEDYVHIEIIDPKITIESLYSVFGSLYMDEVSLEPREIVSILATATLFQLDSLIDRCAEVMIETTNAEVGSNWLGKVFWCLRVCLFIADGGSILRGGLRVRCEER